MVTHRQVITELYNRYLLSGYITEAEAIACFTAYKLSLSDIDAITDHLLVSGAIIKYDVDEEDYTDRSRLDYDKVFREVLGIEPELAVFIDYVRSVIPPQNREWMQLIPQAQNGNEYARNRLIEMYLRVVIKQALAYSKRFGLPLEDTIQDGILGIIKAIDKFTLSEHQSFSTYAPWWIGQSIARRRWLVVNPMYFPFHVKETLFQIQEYVNDHICEECINLENAPCRNLSSQISKKYGLPVATVDSYILHLNQWQYLEDIGIENEIFSDCGIMSEQLFEIANDAEMLERTMTTLSKLKRREREVILMRCGFGEDHPLTLEETGQVFGVTRERVRQIESTAFRKLRAKLRYQYPKGTIIKEKRKA
jgi:RNA polymerase primary sigma factor